MTVEEVAQGGLQTTPISDILHSLLRNQMTLPEFQYPHQNSAYLERLCRRILENQAKENYMKQVMPHVEEVAFYVNPKDS